MGMVQTASDKVGHVASVTTATFGQAAGTVGQTLGNVFRGIARGPGIHWQIWRRALDAGAAGDPMEDIMLQRLKQAAKASGLPTVDQAPRKAFTDSVQAPILPQMPPRRLKELPTVLDTTPQTTKPSRVQTVSEALKDRTYGKLLHRPITKETVEIPYSKNDSILSRFNGMRANQSVAFINWMTDARDPKTGIGLDHDIYNCGAYFLTLGNKDGSEMGTDLNFGINTISWLIASYSERCVANQFRVRSTIPATLKPKEIKVNPQLTYEEQKGLEVTHTGIMSKRLGVGDFPVKVPEFLIKSLEEKDIEINSMPELIAYLIDQLDGLAGQFPIEFEVADTDTLTPGNQPKTLKIHNIAESLAEILGQVITGNINNETLVNICLRTLYQSGSATVAAIVAQDYARANAEFLGYEYKEVVRNINLAYHPEKEELYEILKGKEQGIKSISNKDKRDLNDYLQELLTAASIIRAVHTRKFNANGDLTKQIKDLLLKQKDLADERPKDRNAKNRIDQDWDDFTEAVERGWIDQSGATEKTHPYGRNFGERPRIRDLGKPPKSK